MGAVIHLRDLPSIVVSLGMSFVWGGLAVLLLPAPGGAAPDWVRALMTAKPPLAADGDRRERADRGGRAPDRHALELRRGAARRSAATRARSSAPAGRCCGCAPATYALAGLFAVLAGVTLVGLTTSADANIALRYTLLSIAGVILGGGEFTGGRVSAVGAVIGALTLTLAGSFLTFLRLSPDWQIGAQGAILILVLAIRLLLNRRRGARDEPRWPRALDLVVRRHGASSGSPPSSSPAARAPAG